MSFTETADPVAEAAVETGTAENLGSESVEVPEVTDAPDTEASVDAPQTYKVKVGDTEQSVTLEDLQSGFMRQADYTRKTQEVAQQRQRLAHAESIANSLEADPEGTLRALAEAFGVGVGDEGFDPEAIDPVEQRLRAIEQRSQS